MPTTIKATFDGAVFRPTEPVELAPNTQVELTVNPLPEPAKKPGRFFEIAESMQLEGPSDWSENVDKYLYGEEPRSDR